MKTIIATTPDTTEYEKQIADQQATINDLTTIIERKEAEITELRHQIDWFIAQIKKNNKIMYGQSSEKTEYVAGVEAISLFNEAEKEADPDHPEPEFEEVVIPERIVQKRKKQTGHRDKVLEGLEVEIVEHILNEDEMQCQECEGELHAIGKETVRREVEIIPAKIVVKEHVRVAYGCRSCEKEGEYTPIVKADVPAPLIPKSVASPSAVAYIMYEKYVNAMPLNRQEKDLELHGLKLSRQTMANWVITCAQNYLEPVYEQLHKELIARDIIQADETTVQVLKEEGRKPTTNSYMWLYRTCERNGPPIVLFEYQPTRSAKHPKLFLAGFVGYINCDGYSSYNSISPDIKLQGCFSHCRRYYTDAVDLVPKESRKECEAIKGVEFCNKLFAIERRLKNCSDEKRYQQRLILSKPVLEDFLSWVSDMSKITLDKTRLGKAVTYTLNQWDDLSRFLEDGRLEIHNNAAEQAIRPFTVARKNFLFCDTVNGARASAVTFSIIATAKANGLNPLTYLTFLLDQMRFIVRTGPPGSDIVAQAISRLLPWSPDLPDNCKFKRK
jgi:transposase/uncharacterized coiled-coil protein SlyX